MFNQCTKWGFWHKTKHHVVNASKIVNYVLQAEEDLQELVRRLAEENRERKRNESTCSISQISGFVKPQYLKPFFIVHIFNLFQITCGTNLFIFYASDIIAELERDNFTLVFLSGIRVAVLIVSCFLLVWIKRRTICLTSGAGSGIAALAIALAASVNFYHSWYMFLMLALYVAFNSYGFFVLPSSMVGELLPSSIRSYGGAYIFTINDVGMFAVTKVFPSLISSIGIEGIFWIFGCSSLICTLFLYLLLPETKDQTLVDIEKYFLQDNVLWVKRNKEYKSVIAIREH